MSISDYEELDTHTRVSFVLSLMLLMTALPLTLQLLKRIYDNREQCHVLQLAMAWLLAADLLLILNFGPHHLISFAADRFIGGAYCYISGFWSMVMVVFSNVAAAGCAIVTNKSMGMKSRAYSSWFREKYVTITFLMFIPGIVYGAILAGTSHVGNYRNLYCCMNDNGEAWVIWGGFAIFSVCALIQAHQYYQSYMYVKLQMQNKSVASSPEDQLLRDRFVVGIRDHALRMAALFYIAWFPMMLTGLISYGHGGVLTAEGEAFPRGVDIFVVLCVKIVPLLDCFVIKRSLDKASINSNKKVSLHMNSKGEPISQVKSNVNNVKAPGQGGSRTNGVPTHGRPAEDQSQGTEFSHDSEPPANLTIEFKPSARDEDETITASFAERPTSMGTDALPAPSLESADTGSQRGFDMTEVNILYSPSMTTREIDSPTPMPGPLPTVQKPAMEAAEDDHLDVA
eukprot:gb/GEZN01004479.1/.p1 GENE.gb/GEZN01004479.1/~~gb/GEZN01004479.1/.p1  ORF type:complete len:468 (-),score=23.21 gb/GEZN01004479.1/:556-1920(-)